MRRKGYRWIIFLFISFLFIGFLTIRPVRDTPAWQTKAYHKTIASITDTQPIIRHREGQHWRAGWSKINITPRQPVRLAGFGIRGTYDSIADSAFVRILALQVKELTAVIIGYDLLLVHPHLRFAIEDSLRKDYPDLATYFGATHTHSSFGGWGSGSLADRLLLGGIHDDSFSFLVRQTLQGISLALEQMDSAVLTYEAWDTGNLVYNRIDKSFYTDRWLRSIRVSHLSGNAVRLTTYAAHPISFSRNSAMLSADYPGILEKKLQNRDSLLNFQLFLAGAVGSHNAWYLPDVDETRRHTSYGGRLAEVHHLTPITDSLAPFLSSTFIPIILPQTQFRLSDNWRLNPQLFSWFIGNQQPGIDLLRIGDVALLGIPADYSGEFYPELARAAPPDLHLMLTSFNGSGYIGYITPDIYYDSIRHHDTWEMNWYGPGMGRYFKEILSVVMLKAKHQETER